MNTPDDASLAIQDAENRIRKILATSAAKGDYQRVLELTTAAKQLGAMAAALAKPGAMADGNISPTQHTTTAKREGDYPRFFRRDDEMVKIGWSKKERKEYQHRMPHGTLTTVAAGIAHAGANGKRFSADALAKITDAHGEPVPSYQSYLCLAFLRVVGFVQQEGRSNYSFQPALDIATKTEEAWRALPEL